MIHERETIVRVQPSKPLALQALRRLRSTYCCSSMYRTKNRDVQGYVSLWYRCSAVASCLIHPTCRVERERVTLAWLYCGLIWKILSPSLRASLIYLPERRNYVEFPRVASLFPASVQSWSHGRPWLVPWRTKSFPTVWLNVWTAKFVSSVRFSDKVDDHTEWRWGSSLPLIPRFHSTYRVQSEIVPIFWVHYDQLGQILYSFAPSCSDFPYLPAKMCHLAGFRSQKGELKESTKESTPYRKERKAGENWWGGGRGTCTLDVVRYRST